MLLPGIVQAIGAVTFQQMTNCGVSLHKSRQGLVALPCTSVHSTLFIHTELSFETKPTRASKRACSASIVLTSWLRYDCVNLNLYFWLDHHLLRSSSEINQHSCCPGCHHQDAFDVSYRSHLYHVICQNIAFDVDVCMFDRGSGNVLGKRRVDKQNLLVSRRSLRKRFASADTLSFREKYEWRFEKEYSNTRCRQK